MRRRLLVKNFEAASVALFAALVFSASPAPAQVQLMATPRTAAADTARMMEAFDRADANHDGRLSQDEAEYLPAVAQRFEQIDQDRDGSISRKEFEVAVRM